MEIIINGPRHCRLNCLNCYLSWPEFRKLGFPCSKKDFSRLKKSYKSITNRLSKSNEISKVHLFYMDTNDSEVEYWRVKWNSFMRDIASGEAKKKRSVSFSFNVNSNGLDESDIFIAGIADKTKVCIEISNYSKNSLLVQHVPYSRILEHKNVEVILNITLPVDNISKLNTSTHRIALIKAINSYVHKYNRLIGKKIILKLGSEKPYNKDPKMTNQYLFIASIYSYINRDVIEKFYSDTCLSKYLTKSIIYESGYGDSMTLTPNKDMFIEHPCPYLPNNKNFNDCCSECRIITPAGVGAIIS